MEEKKGVGGGGGMIISENILACSLTVLDISEYTHTRHCCSPIKNAQVPLRLQCFGWPENIKQNQNHRSSYSWCSLIYLQEYNHNIFFIISYGEVCGY